MYSESFLLVLDEAFSPLLSLTYTYYTRARTHTHTRTLGHQVAGVVTLKHIYEIARIKQSDPALSRISLESLCKTIIGSARSLGIEIVR